MFWVLQDQDTGLPQKCHVNFLEPVNVSPSLAVCPNCHAKLEPDFWAPPHKARVFFSACGDLIPGAGFDLVLSTRAWTALKEDKIVGLGSAAPLETVPVTTRSYVVMRPKVTVTRLHEESSNVVWRRTPNCSVCRLGVRESIDRIVLDKTTWDGSDIFVASGLYGLKIVTDKFVNCIERHGFLDFVFVRAGDYSDKMGSR